MKSDFSLAFNQICAEYSLPREVVLDAVRAALVTAYRRDWKIAATQNVTADISLETGLARIYLEKMAVEDVEDATTQITLQEAQHINPATQIEDVVMIDVTPRNFGRIAAQTAKQVIMQRLREAERESQFNRFSRQENEIIIGTIQSVAPHGVTLHLERTEEAHMPRREQIPGERYMLHQKIRVYVLEVKRTSRGPEIIVSRSHPLMLRRLLELEVPEIRAGQVEINAIAREAGTRSKVAVSARQPGLDPVGACVGMRGIRIQTISNELHGERIDVVAWNTEPKAFIANALSMKQVLSVVLDEFNPGGRTASVVVLDNQLSLAIGRSGQNARLAAKLTSTRIDIQGATEAALWALEQVNAKPEIVDDLKESASLIPQLAAVMRTHEDNRFPYTDEERRIIRTTVEAVRYAIIARRNAERPITRQERARRSAREEVQAERIKAKETARARVPQAAYQQKLDALDLSDRVCSHLISSGVRNVGDVMERMALGDEALLMVEGIGTKALREINDAVTNSAFTFIEPGAEEPEAAVVEEAVEAAVTDEGEAAPESDEASAEVGAGVASPVEDETPVDEVEAVVEAEPVVETQPETPAEPEPEPDPFQATPFSALVENFDETFEEEDLEDTSKTKKRKKKKGRAVVYDEETGETFVVRKRRRSHKDVWENYGDDY